MIGSRKGTTLVGGLVVSTLALVTPATLEAQVPLPREVEVQLALSALPEHLRADATVLVYEPPRGLVVERLGTNGFRTFVSRIEPAVFRADRPYTEHPDDVLLPISFDAAGADGPMQPFVEAHALLARGVEPAEMKRLMKERFDSDHYEPAPRTGVSFMLAPVMRSYPNPVASDRLVTLNIPHRMFYAPWVTNEDIGGSPRAGTQPFVIQPGMHGYIGQRAGPDEVAAINAEFADLIERLCQIDARWCLGYDG